MKAWVYRRYGSPDVLQLEEIEPPAPRAGEVAIRVHAAGLDAADWHIMRADPALARIVTGLRHPRRTMTIGSDVAGVVEAVGEGVSAFAPGERVYAEVMFAGGCRQVTTVKAARVARMPTTLDFAQAAAVPMAGTCGVHLLESCG